MQSTISSSAPYRLADHVRACQVDDQVILLDLLRGKYIGIGGPHLRAMSAAVTDWPTAAVAPHAVEASADVSPWVVKLLEQGMLSPASATMSKRATLEEPRETLDADMFPAPYQWSRLARLCWAASASIYSLRYRSLANIARGVTRLQRAALNPADQALRGELLSAVASYLRLRPFVFTAHDKCLFDSLTLMRFLAIEGMAASWVIGVRTRPFGAHSWVQSGPLVLNDLHEHVSGFTPILIV